ncbi:MAG: hypothetical protein ABS943_15165 [Pantoea agglomerans]
MVWRPLTKKLLFVTVMAGALSLLAQEQHMKLTRSYPLFLATVLTVACPFYSLAQTAGDMNTSSSNTSLQPSAGKDGQQGNGENGGAGGKGGAPGEGTNGGKGGNGGNGGNSGSADNPDTSSKGGAGGAGGAGGNGGTGGESFLKRIFK